MTKILGQQQLVMVNYTHGVNQSETSLCSKRFRGVWEQRKMRNRIFRVLPARKMGQEPKIEGGGGEGRKCLQTNPWILKTSVPQRTEFLISRTLLTCVDQRS